jgi:hypothetical protein
MSNIFKSRIATAARSSVVAACIGMAGVSLGFAGAASAADTGMYGNPTAAAKFWQEQTLDDCGPMSVADVVGEITGDSPTEDEIIALAEKTPSDVHPGSIYIRPTDPNDPDTFMGTNMVDLQVLLEEFGIESVATDQGYANEENGPETGIDALKDYLADGHKVIAVVNAETIWNSKGDRTEADHFLVVTGIDAKKGIVHLNDSGIETGRDEQVPLATFLKAWKTSENAMVIAG